MYEKIPMKTSNNKKHADKNENRINNFNKNI